MVMYDRSLILRGHSMLYSNSLCAHKLSPSILIKCLFIIRSVGEKYEMWIIQAEDTKRAKNLYQKGDANHLYLCISSTF